MKVCMLTASVSRLGGGVFSALQGLAIALHHPPDLAVSVVGLRDRLTDEDRCAWNPLSLQVCDIHGPRSWGFAGALAPALRSVGADLTHVHGLWMYPSLVNLMQARGGMPYVISPHGMLDPWAVANANWKKRLVLWLYEAAHLNGAGCIHVLCEAERRAIRAFGLKNPVCIIPNGVDLADSPSGRPGAPDWSEEVPPGCKMLLFLGRIHPKKNLIALLRAWSLAQRRRVSGFSDWHLVIAGWDQSNHRHELQTLAKELGIAGHVCFAPPQYGAAKRITYAAVHGAVLPSLSEGFPIAILEAWSAGLPVLMTPECNLPEGFERGAAQRIATDPASIADGLADFFALSDEERREMGKRGRQLVEDRFVWDRIADDTGAVYRWLIDGGAPPPCVVFD